ncbi:heme lyase CcmF/NrfE family subunit [Thermus thermamylovorans]|uniref:Heme lyase CcmF/NrfE family subunit n=1 Tax=Thermus thermamylovorans TaxID=2509362 RepID=A0A4Q9AZ16_9DEIN|nr:cytochrome c-type biogenesis CcmF C-terminal domain-containing protein [Thermus thermamylovorans]TBH15338.1 heme lyase CcmF/NrfE family subunit [Thermus thermamylovorans]
MNPALLGNLGVTLTLAFSLLGAVLALLAYFQGDGRYLRGARALVLPAFLSALAAFLALEWALLTHDFSLAYVARNHSTQDPLWVTLVTPWAALEGSILLWGLLQTFYTWLASRKALDPWRASVVLAVLFGVQSFFFGVMATIASPFETLPNPPADGVGPNPLLQNHWMMAVHPVLMYLGFVGLSVPFAYAVAAMATRRYQTWVEETRWWTLIAWGFLTAGKVAGMWWAYEVLGWGGYWGWDPVENASFLPWLMATAFLHTAIVQQTRGAFKVWNFAFITLAFAATVLGTFITRSGIIMSVHAFAEGPVGPAFLGFFLVSTALGLGLLSQVAREVRDTAVFRLLSREGALLLGAFFFSGWALVVLFGTFYPLLVEAFTGARVSVGAPFFDQVSIPIGVGLLLLMGIGPLLPWRRTRAEVFRNLYLLLLVLALGTLVGLLRGYTPGASLAVGLFLYNLTAIFLLAREGVLARLKAGLSPWGFLENRRRVGSLVVHFGVALMALGIAFSQAYRLEQERTLYRGQAWEVAGVRMEFLGVRARDEGRRFAVEAHLRTDRFGDVYPRLNFYPQMQGPLATPVVLYTPVDDFYFVLMDFDREEGQWASIRLIVTPMVFWMWVAGGLMALGTLYILWPVRRPEEAKGVSPA